MALTLQVSGRRAAKDKSRAGGCTRLKDAADCHVQQRHRRKPRPQPPVWACLLLHLRIFPNLVQDLLTTLASTSIFRGLMVPDCAALLYHREQDNERDRLLVGSRASSEVKKVGGTTVRQG
jgi:hypothetical protein